MAPISLPMGSVGLPTFQLTFNKAMRAYKKRTKIDIHLDPLAFVFQSCNDSAAALSVLQQQAQVQSWSDNEGLMSSLRPSVDKLYLISSCIEPGVGLVTIIDACSTYVLQTILLFLGIITCESHYGCHRCPPFGEDFP